MSCLCGWVPAGLGAAGHAESVIEAMGRALRVHAGQSWAGFRLEGLAVGLVDLPAPAEGTGVGAARLAAEPAVAGIARHYLWMAGEAYASDGLVEVRSTEESRTLAFRRRLLEALLDRGPEAIDRLDGAFQIALWDAEELRLTLLNDRFGCLPLYLGVSDEGMAFGGGVRGVLMAPGIDSSPDPEALREAVSFGGFRLGGRTNVVGVEMVPGGSIVLAQGSEVSRRQYRHWPRPDTGSTGRDPKERVEQARELWRRAVHRRLTGATNPGQTLSGGLDSRAILGEATLQVSDWTAVTYGLAGCDDAIYARQAAQAAGADWKFLALYESRPPDWLDRRSVHIQATDGLIELSDLRHLECLPAQRGLDLHVSGYIGDVVCGDSYDGVRDTTSLLTHLPYSGSPLGWTIESARGWADAQLHLLDGAPGRFAIFEHKLAQAIHRIFQAYAPWVRVRKPFLDHDLFEFFSAMDGPRRANLYHRMLKESYPSLFSIPNQQTGMPVLTPHWRVQVERARRLAARKARPWLGRLGIEIPKRIRGYSDESTHWRHPEARRRIESVVLAPDSLTCEILGRQPVTVAVEGWFERGAGPVQVIGALFSFETYHRDLATHLTTWQRTPSTL